MFDKNRKPRIALDFDGVLHGYQQGYTGTTPLDPPVPGAVEFVNWCVSQGFSVVIFTARLSHLSDLHKKMEEHEGAIMTWLNYHGFPVEHLSLTGYKPAADLYVDDRGYRFTGEYSFKILKHGIGTGEFLKSWTERCDPTATPCSHTSSYGNPVPFAQHHPQCPESKNPICKRCGRSFSHAIGYCACPGA